tara:strand:+ start:283 stop:534 length:252 start_codon:yes stop_codon:yes gene_type:complete
MKGQLQFPPFKNLSRNGSVHIGALYLFRIPDVIALGAMEFVGMREKYAVGLVIAGEIPGKFPEYCPEYCIGSSSIPRLVRGTP